MDNCINYYLIRKKEESKVNYLINVEEIPLNNIIFERSIKIINNVLNYVWTLRSFNDNFMYHPPPLPPKKRIASVNIWLYFLGLANTCIRKHEVISGLYTLAGTYSDVPVFR